MPYIVRYYWTDDGKQKFAVYSDGTESLVAEYDEYGNYSFLDERGNWNLGDVEVIGEKPNKLKWWQQYDPEKAEQARQSWNEWMPQRYKQGSNPYLFRQLGNTSSNSSTPKVLQTPVLGGDEHWQKRVIQPNTYDGPDYNRDARMREEFFQQYENEKNGIFDEEKRWNTDSRAINYFEGSGWENEVNKYSSERGGYTYNLLGGDIKVVRFKNNDGKIIYAPFVSPGFAEEGIVDITNIYITTLNVFFSDRLTDIIYGIPDKNQFLLEEFEGDNLIAKIDFKQKSRVMLAGRTPKVRLKSSTKNAVYARIRNKLPYIGMSKDVLKRYLALDRLQSGLKTIHNLAKYDNKLLRAIERRMYEYLKVERGLKIDNRRKPMNDKDYGLYFNKVQRTLQNTNWKSDLDKMFP